ncbi:hypothetical protein BX666DRAFT_1931039 [Dichotomocladium elegans]|nr:hypothetical protein BX666DRAFT_1931039 [Dichotomocladium elegans]
MSLDNLAFDLSRLSFDTATDLRSTNSTTPSFLTASEAPTSRMTNTIYGNRAASMSTGGLPSITITQEKKTPSSRDRNRQCVPSDDEDDEDEDDDRDSSDEEERRNGKKKKKQQQQHRQQARKVQLPSDDEENEEDDDDSDSEPVVAQSSPMYRRLSGVGSTSNLTAGIGRRSPSPQLYQPQQQQQQQFYQQPLQGGGGGGVGHQYHNGPTRPGQVVKRHSDGHLDNHHNQALTGEGTHLYHLQQMQHYQQAQIAQYNMRPHHRVSGMDLLKQLEQEKAEQKRMKPKINPSHVKIEKGLLANLPEPGSHSISFQAMQKQASDQQKYQQQMQYYYTTQQQASMHPQPQYHAPPPQQQQHYHHHHHQQQQQQQQQFIYPYTAANGAPHHASSSPSLVMMDQYIPSRPSSALSSYQQDNRRRSGE